MVDMNNLIVSVYKYHIKGYDNIFHPVMLHLVAVMDKEHAVSGGKIRPVHKPADLFGGRNGGFSFDAAQFTAPGIEERNLNLPDLCREPQNR